MKKYLLAFSLAISSVTGWSQVSLSTGLKVYYPFTGNGNNAAPGGGSNAISTGATLTQDGANSPNSAYLLNSASYLTSNGANFIGTSNSKFSASIWVKPTLFTTGNWPVANGMFAAKGNTNVGGEWALFYFDADPSASVYKLRFGARLQLNSTSYTFIGENSSIIPELNKWYNITLTVDGTTGVLILYVNGGIQEVKALPPFTLPGTNSGEFRLGGNYASSFRFTGAIDEFRYYDRLLNPQEAYAIFSQYTVLGIARDQYADLKPAYPNPANGRLHITHGLKAGESGTLRIYDITGREISSNPISSLHPVVAVNTSGLKGGLHHYQVECGSEAGRRERFVIQK